MLKLLTATQIKEVDAFTIRNEPVSSLDLMERACRAFLGFFVNHFPDKSIGISVYAGTGNNGGDGLAISRMLHQHGYRNLSVKVARFGHHPSDDFEKNFKRLTGTGIMITQITPQEVFPQEDAVILIDALLGSGLNKPLTGEFSRLATYINDLKKVVVAVDVPTGFFTEGELDPLAPVIKADLVITFQQPKVNFLLPEAASSMDCWEVVPIGLDEKFMNSLQTNVYYTEEKDIRQLLNRRLPFQHKGSFGHALIVAGQQQTMGAALLCSRGCVYAGTGLTTACIPEEGTVSLNAYMPEIMLVARNEKIIPDIAWTTYNSLAIGPGLGKDANAEALLSAVLSNFRKPMVIDADALNMLCEKKELWTLIPKGTVLTPHVKEFDRLFGIHTSWWARLETIRRKAKEYNIFIILKNRYSILGTPGGDLYFNPTGNPSMATGGMGDVLTGIIASFLAQGYVTKEACLIALFVHGRAGDELAVPNRLSTVLPGDLAAQLPVTIGKLQG
ncbi:MAG: NAD(P)H-hydrate dehydratase [Sphingobacteriaceae bacterium]